MKRKTLAVLQSALLCIIMLAFPIASGVFAVVMELGTIETLFLQGGFMAASLSIPAVMVLTGKCKIKEIGFDRIDRVSFKRLGCWLPFLLIFVPVAIRGFSVRSTGYFFGVLFLYSFVGVAEEVYFRGIIPFILKKEFSLLWVIILSSFLFGVGHVATAFTASSGWEIALTVLNALLFGFMAIESAIVANNIFPGILIHFLFDFETKIITMSGQELFVAECIRGAIMTLLAIWLTVTIFKNKKYYTIDHKSLIT